LPDGRQILVSHTFSPLSAHSPFKSKNLCHFYLSIRHRRVCFELEAALGIPFDIRTKRNDKGNPWRGQRKIQKSKAWNPLMDCHPQTAFEDATRRNPPSTGLGANRQPGESRVNFEFLVFGSWRSG
jgi:hypothetical protein